MGQMMHAPAWMGRQQQEQAQNAWLTGIVSFVSMAMVFVLGTAFGMLMGKKKAAMMMGGKNQAWGPGHHHHGDGGPCGQHHRTRPASGEMAAPGARPDEERNEGE